MGVIILVFSRVGGKLILFGLVLKFEYDIDMIDYFVWKFIV